MHVQRRTARELSKLPAAKPRLLIELHSKAEREGVNGAKALLGIPDEPAEVMVSTTG